MAVLAVIADVLAWLFIAAGIAFVLIGAIGIARLPDFYTRLHAAGVTDTLGAELVLFGLMFHAGWSLDTAKLALIALFLFLTSPTATHAAANAAYVAGVQPVLTRIRSRRPDTGDDGDAA